MVTAPLVSVITPFLEEASHLDDCVRSVLAQTDRSWELLLVDDGSTDGSAGIAGRWASEDPERIRVLAHPGGVNRGRSESRNLGLSAARGEFVAFLDADDVFLPFKLERQVAVLRDHPQVGMLVAAFLHWHSPALDDHHRKPDFVSPLVAAPGTLLNPPDLLSALLRDEDVHPANNAMLIRADVCRDVGGFDPTFDLYEDTVFLAKVSLRTSAIVSGDCSAVYRLHPESTCFRAEASGEWSAHGTSPARRAYLEWLEGHLAAEAVDDEEVVRLLRRELRPYRQPARHAAATTTRSLLGKGRRRARSLVRRR